MQLAALFLWAANLAAQTPTSTAISLEEAKCWAATSLLEVVFKGSPNPAEVTPIRQWSVLLKTENGVETRRLIPNRVRTKVVGTGGEARTFVELYFDRDSGFCDLKTYPQSTVTWAELPKQPLPYQASRGSAGQAPDRPLLEGLFGPYQGSSRAKEANIYLSGLLIAGRGASPSYAWEVKADPNVALRPGWGHLGFKFNGIARKERNLDPDSLTLSPFYRYSWSGSQILTFESNFAGFEFERRAKSETFQKNANFVTRHTLTWTPAASRREALPGIVITPEITFIGIDIGRNLESFDNREGRGLVYRQVHGAKLYFYPKLLKNFDRANLESAWRVLLPHRPEPFYTDPEQPPILTTKARHYVENALNIGLAKGVSFTVKHLYGSLPPSFVFQDHQFTFGFTLAFEQASSNHKK